MKSKAFRVGVSTFIFLLMVATVLLAVIPIHRAIQSRLHQIKTLGLARIEEQTGLSVSYESISPSFLTGIRLRGLSVRDSYTQEEVLAVSNVTVLYQLWGLRGTSVEELVSRIKSVSLDGLQLAWNSRNQRLLFEKLSQPGGNKSAESGEDASPVKVLENLSSFKLPCTVNLKNISLTFEQEAFVARATVPLFRISPLPDGGNSVKMSGRIRSVMRTETLNLPKWLRDYILDASAIGFSLDGRIAEGLVGSRIQTTITTSEGERLSFAKSALSLSWTDSGLAATLLSPRVPYSLKALYSFEPGTVSLRLEGDRFKPMDLLRIQSKDDVLSRLKNLQLSGVYELSFGKGFGDISYRVDGSVSVPPEVVPDGMSLVMDFGGTLESIDVARLDISAPWLDFSYAGNVAATGGYSLGELRPQGDLSIEKLRLPSGELLETQVYIEPLPKGFMLFAPQVYAGDVAITAVQLECVPNKGNIDFAFEASDYSHAESGNPGVLSVQGFVSYDQGISVQAGVSVSNLFLEDAVTIAAPFLPPERRIPESVSQVLSPYILSMEVFATTDFHSIVYNMPYAVLANTTRDDQLLFLSLDGTETTVSVSQFSALYAGQEVSGSFSADSDSAYHDIFYGASLTVNGLPYTVSGSFTDRTLLTMQGDYGLFLNVSLGRQEGVSGSVTVSSMPLAYSSFLLQLSADMAFHYRSLADFSADITAFEVAERSGAIRTQPGLQFSGRLSQLGFGLDTIVFSDTASLLRGQGSMYWNLAKDNAAVFTTVQNAGASLSLDSQLTGESLAVSFSVTNPSLYSFRSPRFLENCYVQADAAAESVLMSHFLSEQARENRVSLTLTALGALSNPSVLVNVPSAVAKVGGQTLSASLDAALEDGVVELSGLEGSWGPIVAGNTTGSLDTKTVRLNLETTLSLSHPLVSFRAPLSIDADARNGFSDFKANLLIKRLESSLAETVRDYPVSFERSAGLSMLRAGKTDGVQLLLMEDGEFFGSATAEFPILFNTIGSIKDNRLDVNINDIKFGFDLLTAFFHFNQFSVYGGQLSGDLHLGGQLSDPTFNGALVLENYSMGLPGWVDAPFNFPKMDVTVQNETFTMQSDKVECGGAQCSVDFSAVFEGFRFDRMVVKAKTLGGKNMVKGKFRHRYIDVYAKGAPDIVFEMTSNEIHFSGSIDANETVAVMNNNFLSESPPPTKYPWNIFVDLDLNVAPKAQFYYPNTNSPIVRGLANAETPLHINYNYDDGIYSMDGAFSLRGGEILYLNRTFYLREGRLVLNEDSTRGMNPLVNLRAEIRERNSNDELIRIILSIPDQHIRQLSPVLSSVPSLSDLELRTLLGAVMVAESGTSATSLVGQMAAAGVDYLIHNNIVRDLENQLRDFFHFDIFSFRTQFIQRALAQILDQNGGAGDAALGNFFDNTTVYIGKYIGTAVYFDALVALRYDKAKGADSIGRFSVQPEIGFEFPAPFATIRWSIAPDITTTAQNLWVPYTSLSLSWKFSF